MNHWIDELLNPLMMIDCDEVAKKDSNIEIFDGDFKLHETVDCDTPNSPIEDAEYEIIYGENGDPIHYYKAKKEEFNGYSRLADDSSGTDLGTTTTSGTSPYWVHADMVFYPSATATTEAYTVDCDTKSYRVGESIMVEGENLIWNGLKWESMKLSDLSVDKPSGIGLDTVEVDEFKKNISETSRLVENGLISKETAYEIFTSKSNDLFNGVTQKKPLREEAHSWAKEIHNIGKSFDEKIEKDVLDCIVVATSAIFNCPSHHPIDWQTPFNYNVTALEKPEEVTAESIKKVMDKLSKVENDPNLSIGSLKMQEGAPKSNTNIFKDYKSLFKDYNSPLATLHNGLK